MALYNYSLTNNFGGNLEPFQLQIDIEDNDQITTQLGGVSVNSDNVVIDFSTDLTTLELTQLNTVISDYSFVSVITDNILMVKRNVDPTNGDCRKKGFTVGSRWINTANRKEFMLYSDETGQALWRQVTNAEKYDATVGKTGEEDYSSIGAALAAGKRSIYVRSGVYVETGDLDLSDGQILLGEGPAAPIIYFALGHGVKINAVTYKENTGTIGIENGSANVHGAGTTFTNINATDFILIGQTFYDIDTISDNSTLVLKDIYHGNTITDSYFQAHNIYSGVVMQNFIILGNGTNIGLTVRGVRHTVLSALAFKDCYTSYHVRDSSVSALSTLASQNSIHDGAIVEDCFSIHLGDCASYNSGRHGLAVKGDSICVVAEGCVFTSNQTTGICVAGNTSNFIIGESISNRNNGTGIETLSTTNTIIVNGCICTENGGKGVFFRGTNNTIGYCLVGNNASDGIFANIGASITSNHIYYNQGHGINMNNADDCQISGNDIYNNTFNGIQSSDNGHRNVISSNTIRKNKKGVYFESGDNNMFNDNSLNDNDEENIFLRTCNDTIISSNCIQDSNIGICIESDCNYFNICGNTFKTITTDALIINNSCHGLVNGNIFHDNSGNAVNITSGTDIMVNGNHYVNNGTDIINLSTIVKGTFDIIPKETTYISNNLQIKNSTTDSNYAKVGGFLYEGANNYYEISSFKILSHMDVSSTSYDVRIQDITNSNTIAESTGLTNTDESIITLSAISNLPTQESIFNLQMKVTGGGSCHCETLVVKY